VEDELLRDALARLAHGVVLVATRDAAGFRGVTVTSFVPVSLDPPLVMLGLDRLSAARDAVLEAAAFNASVLARGHHFLADRFSGQTPVARPDWADVPHRLGSNRLPVIEGAAGWFECEVEAVHPAGDHDVVIARVLAAGVGGGEPLVHWERGYWTLTR
jgi:flavin reductase (DIM6/NTAB) family NADH-FMN oxidoreductase RutF